MDGLFPTNTNIVTEHTMNSNPPDGPAAAVRAAQLHRLARAYVIDALGKGDFEAIPYSEAVVLRAPLCPGGSGVPLAGRANLREKWWAPLPTLVAGVEVVDTYVNRDLTGVAVEFLCHLRQPACMLRVVDRFQVDAAGRITGQENFFDPRDATDPEWRNRER